MTARPLTGLTLTGATAVTGATAGCFAGSGFFAWASAVAVVMAKHAGTSSHTNSRARFMGDLLGNAVSDEGHSGCGHDTAKSLIGSRLPQTIEWVTRASRP